MIVELALPPRGPITAVKIEKPAIDKRITIEATYNQNGENSGLNEGDQNVNKQFLPRLITVKMNSS